MALYFKFASEKFKTKNQAIARIVNFCVKLNRAIDGVKIMFVYLHVKLGLLRFCCANLAQIQIFTLCVKFA